MHQQLMVYKALVQPFADSGYLPKLPLKANNI